MYDLMNKLYL